MAVLLPARERDDARIAYRYFQSYNDLTAFTLRPYLPTLALTLPASTCPASPASPGINEPEDAGELPRRSG